MSLLFPKKEAALKQVEPIVFKLFFFCLKSFDYKQRIEIQRIRNRNCSIPAIAKAFTLRDL
ncbi:predicted protein [Enterococcus gallinarum EG2]|nr:predicted protein [Enterococcus gallinarum EG2]